MPRPWPGFRLALPPGASDAAGGGCVGLGGEGGGHSAAFSSRAGVRGHPRRVPDIRWMRRLLGVSPEVSVEEGLRQTIEWFKRNGLGSVSERSRGMENFRRSQIKSIAQRAALAALGCLIAVAIIEAGLRVWGAERLGLFFVLPKGLADLRSPSHLQAGFRGTFRTPAFTTELRINSKGLRDVERSYEKPAKVYRILALGDSMTFGWGVEAEETYVSLLEKCLSTRLGWRFEIINAGIPGAGTQIELDYLLREGMKYEPDLVLLGFFIGNDLDDNMAEEVEGTGTLPGDRQERWTPTWRDLLRKYSYLYSLAANTLKAYGSITRFLGKVNLVIAIPGGYFIDMYRKEPNPRYEVAWHRTFELIKGLREASQNRLFVVLIPDELQVNRRRWELALKQLRLSQNEFDLTQVNRRLARFLSTEGIPFLDPLDDFRNHNSRAETLYFPSDSHLTRASHHLLADRLCTAMAATEFLRFPKRVTDNLR